MKLNAEISLGLFEKSSNLYHPMLLFLMHNYDKFVDVSFSGNNAI